MNFGVKFTVFPIFVDFAPWIVDNLFPALSSPSTNQSVKPIYCHPLGIVSDLTFGAGPNVRTARAHVHLSPDSVIAPPAHGRNH